MKSIAARIGIKLLDATTRTWGAFWGTIAVWVFYWLWNARAPIYDRFDPYPFVFLTLLITQASYLQNIVLMTDQRLAAIELEKLHAKQAAQDTRQIHMIETLLTLCAVLVEHAKRAEARDLASVDRDRAILAAITGDIDDGR